MPEIVRRSRSTSRPFVGRSSVRHQRARGATWLLVAGLLGCGVEDSINHGDALGIAYSGGTPGAPCRDSDVPEAGYCIDYGPDGHATCEQTDECRPGYVCRAFDVPACTCDTRPGAWEQCAPTCTTDADCNRSRSGDSVSWWGHVCDQDRGICRHPFSCLDDGDCDAPEICADGDWLHWYVGGDEQLHEMVGPRRCSAPGTLPDGADCWLGDECASGSCFAASTGRECASSCSNNAQCPDGVCLQTSWGAPSCRPLAESTCEGPGEADAFCHRGEWVVGCSRGRDCETGDCRLPEGGIDAFDYGGFGFGLGHCIEDNDCGDDERRSAWRDAWATPACLTADPCWNDSDCASPLTCLALDAIGSTRRCGYELDGETPAG